jgi:bilin biosynthesis protein
MTQETLFEQLKHPNPNLRERAMWEIVDTRDETTIPRLMAALDDEDVVYRRAAVKALGAVGMDTIPSLVEGMLNSDNVTVRGSCAKALAQVALNYPDEPFPAQGLQGLKTALEDLNPVVHIGAAMALGEIGSPACEILIEVLGETDNVGLAVSLINALAAVGDEQASSTLNAYANNEAADSYVRESAVSALSRLDMVKGFKRADGL